MVTGSSDEEEVIEIHRVSRKILVRFETQLEKLYFKMSLLQSFFGIPCTIVGVQHRVHNSNYSIFLTRSRGEQFRPS